MKTIKIAYVTTNETDVLPFIEGLAAANSETGDAFSLAIRTGGDLMGKGKLEEFIGIARESCLLAFHLHGGEASLPCFEELMEAMEGSGVPVHAQAMSIEQNVGLMDRSTVPRDEYIQLARYIDYGGADNFRNLLLYAANRYAGADCEAAPPEKPAWDGIYHPDFDHVPSLNEYLEKKCLPDRPTVGLWFYQSYWLARNTEYVDVLIREIESQGANVLPVFFYGMKDVELGTKDAREVIDDYFFEDGECLIDVLISTQIFSMSTRLEQEEDVSKVMENGFLERLPVAVIKAILTMNTYEDWHDSFQGLNPMDVTFSVAMPEMDGTLITVPVAARTYTENDPVTGARIVRYDPIPERVAKLVRLSIKWGRLRHIPAAEKKVAIIFHHYPPRNDRIGCAFGLDSPVSVRNILRDMQEEGYTLDRLPESGQELIDDMIARVTNDRRWASAEQLAERSVDHISPAQYGEWFRELPEDIQARMKQDWGEPPGEIFFYGGNLLVPGIINGNVFIGLQPPRGFLDNPEAIYHSPDLTIPYHYHAYYRWIRDVFKADVVMHIGKHGSLEWLPGKSVGLSVSCFPDIAIADLPNIYPYIINNPGEGTQAKRRSYCCIIDHLVPVMHNADAYEEMAELQVLQNDYYQATNEDPGKLPGMRKTIWEKTCQAKLDHDLKIDEETVFADFDDFLEKLHGYISEMADTQIRDGLHTFGEPPVEERLDEFLVALTRLANGGVPSFRHSLAEFKGYDYDELLENRGKRRADGTTNGGVIESFHGTMLDLVRTSRETGFDTGNLAAVVQDVLGKRDKAVERVLGYIAGSIVPDIAATTDELTNTLGASRGAFVPPGPSGPPTRGMADILPTGRNFYSVDPMAIPSPAAWKVGISLGDALMERYIQDEGKYPESLGMIIWGCGTMRTKGDDMAEILYLLGAKPVWEPSSGRVKGIEILPLEQLKHPRIDITLRISGFFRDAFPNLVNLLDDTMEKIANLDEPPEKNFLAKHVREEVAEKVAAGMDAEQAREEAGYRIFSDRPGAYGAGVSDAIDSKNWKDQNDLGEIYVLWGGYAYTRKTYGVHMPEEFKRRLSRMDATVKNEDTREYDMLDGDDFYSYHGGLIAAVKAFKGELPRAYSGDGSDPDRVKIRSTEEETKHIFRARLLNPKWIDSMKRHGYKGAGDMSRAVDIAFGWDATAEVLEDWMYEELAGKYALDPAMQDWLKEVNPYALQNITERLLEAVERGMWQATEEMQQELRDIYLNIEGVLEEGSEA